MFEIILRWAWGTLLTAIVTAVLTLLLKHGHRWFRGARKFIRTGRLGGRAKTRRTQVKTPAARMPKLTMEQRFMMFLARLNGKSPWADTQTRPNSQVLNDDESRLDLKF